MDDLFGDNNSDSDDLVADLLADDTQDPAAAGATRLRRDPQPPAAATDPTPEERARTWAWLRRSQKQKRAQKRKRHNTVAEHRHALQKRPRVDDGSSADAAAVTSEAERSASDTPDAPESDSGLDDAAQAANDATQAPPSEPAWPRQFIVRAVGMDSAPYVVARNRGKPAVLFVEVAGPQRGQLLPQFRAFGAEAQDFASPFREYKLTLNKISGCEPGDNGMDDDAAEESGAAAAAGRDDGHVMTFADTTVRTTDLGIPLRMCDVTVTAFNGTNGTAKKMTPAMVMRMLKTSLYYPMHLRDALARKHSTFLKDYSMNKNAHGFIPPDSLRAALDSVGFKESHPLSMVCRNVFATDLFFTRVLLVGSVAASKIPYSETDTWRVLEGTLSRVPASASASAAAAAAAVASDDEGAADFDEMRLYSLLERVYHYNALTDAQIQKLHANMNIDVHGTRDFQARLDALQMAAKVFHDTIQSRVGVTLGPQTTNAWPPCMRETLEQWGLSIERRNGTWVAQTAQAIASRSRVLGIVASDRVPEIEVGAGVASAALAAMNAGDTEEDGTVVRLVRSEFDTSTSCDGGYFACLRDASRKHAPMLVFANTRQRADTLAFEVPGAIVREVDGGFGSTLDFGRYVSVWVDRAHDLPIASIEKVTVAVKGSSYIHTLFIAGSTWISAPGAPNDFRSLFMASRSEQRVTTKETALDEGVVVAQDTVDKFDWVVIARTDDAQIPVAWAGTQRQPLHALKNPSAELPFSKFAIAVTPDWKRGDLMFAILRLSSPGVVFSFPANSRWSELLRD